MPSLLTSKTVSISIAVPCGSLILSTRILAPCSALYCLPLYSKSAYIKTSVHAFTALFSVEYQLICKKSKSAFFRCSPNNAGVFYRSYMIPYERVYIIMFKRLIAHYTIQSPHRSSRKKGFAEQHRPAHSRVSVKNPLGIAQSRADAE